ncbi:MAG TPA: amino acid ABC transporter permease [Candidatus Borkfalkia avicola]|uniref:Amino acid ABC transporter permease n=1 Tax=Candidatus Borkfalkia avicola TaxID=2838503 RepID=A0A9D2IHB5_9FIRM|nr:amino acid ABC transporter permease [Candidatus Borkfalkia avicola]
MNKLEIFFRYFIEYENYKIVLIGLRNTLVIAICGLLIGIVVGSVVAAFKVAGTRSRVAKAVSYVGDAYTGIFRGTPIIVQLIVFHYVILRGSGINPLLEAVLVFGLNSGAYVAEIMRGGILSVDVGQLEAGRTLGLSYGTTMLRVVIPQAIKNVVPTLGNELIALTKDTSVAGYVATMDLNAAFTAIAGATYDYLVPYLFLALIYLVLVIIFTVIIRFVERRMRKSERR